MYSRIYSGWSDGQIARVRGTVATDHCFRAFLHLHGGLGWDRDARFDIKKLLLRLVTVSLCYILLFWKKNVAAGNEHADTVGRTETMNDTHTQRTTNWTLIMYYKQRNARGWSATNGCVMVG